MPYKDPAKAKADALERSRRYKAKKRAEKYGPDAPDQRGKHNNHKRGSQHYRWNNERITSEHGYIKVRVGVGHPLADPNGYAYEHLLVVLTSNTPGASLLRKHPDEWVIHHQNGDKTDNRIENLQVVQRSEHSTLHNTTRQRDGHGRFIGTDGIEHNAYPV